MFDLASLFLGAASAVGIAALLSTDPVIVKKTTVPTLVEYQGYGGPVVAKLLRERIRFIAREASTSRGDLLGVFNAKESTIDTLAANLRVNGVVNAFREFLGLHSYMIDAYIAHHGDGLKFVIKGETAAGELFFVSVKGGHDIPALIDAMAERLIERVDPYVLTLYYFRQEAAGGVFAKTLPMIEHSARVLQGDLVMWPLLLWGDVHRRQGRYDEAIAKYRRVLDIAPWYTEAIALWGLALIDKGDIAGGLEKLREAAAWADQDPTQRNEHGWPTVHVYLGDALVRQGNYEEAFSAYVSGLELVPSNPYLKASLASLYLRHGQPEPAIRLLSEAIRTHPEKADLTPLLDRALAETSSGSQP